MKRTAKRRHYFLIVRMIDDLQDSQVLLQAVLQTPKVQERFAHIWMIKMARDWLRDKGIEKASWCSYEVYPVNKSQVECFTILGTEFEGWVDHIHITDGPSEEEDREFCKWYNDLKLKAFRNKPKIV